MSAAGMRPAVNIDDLPAETRKKLGLRPQRRTEFSKEHVRSFAIKVLAEVSDLTQDQRRRVLEHAVKVNRS